MENNAAIIVIGREIEVGNNEFKKFNFYVSIIRNCFSSNKSKSKYISCCEGFCKNDSSVVRRFHFDISIRIPEIFETKSHLQFGGICHEQSAFFEYYGSNLHYCLDNRIDIPRLPYPPLDIITLLDIFLRQFNTSIDYTFEKKKEWIDLVRKSEDFQLKNITSK